MHSLNSHISSRAIHFLLAVRELSANVVDKLEIGERELGHLQSVIEANL